MPLLRKAARLTRLLPYLDMDAQDHASTDATEQEQGQEQQQQG